MAPQSTPANSRDVLSVGAGRIGPDGRLFFLKANPLGLASSLLGPIGGIVSSLLGSSLWGQDRQREPGWNRSPNRRRRIEQNP